MSTVSKQVSNERGSRSRLFKLVFLLIIAMILYSVFLMNQMRFRTASAVKRVEEIHRSIIAWQSQFISEENSTSLGKIPVPENDNFLDRVDPEASNWLKVGDEFYQYAYSGIRYEKGRTFPLVSATAKDPENVFGEVITSNSDGTASVSRISESVHRFNLFDFISERPFLTGALLFLIGLYLWMNSLERTKSAKV